MWLGITDFNINSDVNDTNELEEFEAEHSRYSITENLLKNEFDTSGCSQIKFTEKGVLSTRHVAILPTIRCIVEDCNAKVHKSSDFCFEHYKLICKVENCTNKSVKYNLCEKHKSKLICCIENCEEKNKCNGLCIQHYNEIKEILDA
jgi:hypothetical protein